MNLNVKREAFLRLLPPHGILPLEDRKRAVTLWSVRLTLVPPPSSFTAFSKVRPLAALLKITGP